MRTVNELRSIQGWIQDNEIVALQKCACEQQKTSTLDFLEIGSWKGLSAVAISSALQGDRRLWLVDHFRGNDTHQKGQRWHRAPYLPRYRRRGGLWAYPELLENVIKFGVQDKVIVVPFSSEDAAKVVKETFGFIFIDGDHKGADKDWKLWGPQLALGGHVFFHDSTQPLIHDACAAVKKDPRMKLVYETTMTGFVRVGL